MAGCQSQQKKSLSDWIKTNRADYAKSGRIFGQNMFCKCKSSKMVTMELWLKKCRVSCLKTVHVENLMMALRGSDQSQQPLTFFSDTEEEKELARVAIFCAHNIWKHPPSVHCIKKSDVL